MLNETFTIEHFSDPEESSQPDDSTPYNSEDASPNGRSAVELIEQKREYDLGHVKLLMFIEQLWGPERLYSPTEREKVSLFKDFYYGWVYRTMKLASREELDENVLPPPPYKSCARVCGMKLSLVIQDDLYVRNSWNCLLGAEVVSRLDPMSRGILRWVGVPQQGGYNRMMAGVEWKVIPTVRLARHSSNPAESPIFDGVVHGEHLFNPKQLGVSTLEECTSINLVFAPRSTGFGKTVARPKRLNIFSRLIEVLPDFFWRQFPLKLCSDFFTLLIPILLKYYVKFLETNDSQSWIRAAFLVLALFLAQLFQSCLLHRYYYWSIECGLQFRSALSILLFEKCFTISKKAMSHPKINTGRIINLISSDAENVNQFMQHMMYLWSTAFLLTLSIVQMKLLVGWCCLTSVVVFLLSLPIMTLLTKSQVQLSKKRVAVTDERVKATNEFFSGIRIAKYVTWEAQFINKIEQKRATEVGYLRQIQIVRIFLFVLNNGIPMLMIASVFTLYSLLGNELKPSIIFPTLSLLEILQRSCVMIPYIINATAQFVASMERITEFLECSNEELSNARTIDGYSGEGKTSFSSQLAVIFKFVSVLAYVSRKLPEAPKVKMSKLRKLARLMCIESHKPAKRYPPPTTFLEEVEPMSPVNEASEAKGFAKVKKPTELKGHFEVLPKLLLRDVSLQVPKGKLTVVLGPTGCGKSTLLQAILGQLEVSKGYIWAIKNIAYVPQQPWIMNASLRENILFFTKESTRLAEAIRVSQLETDIKLLESGLETEIGEKGINLSGGQKARVSLARAIYADREMYLLDDPLAALDAHVSERIFTECILGKLAGKTRILTTHQWHVAEKSDYVIVLEDQRVVFSGESSKFLKSMMYRGFIAGSSHKDEEAGKIEVGHAVTPVPEKNEPDNVPVTDSDVPEARQTQNSDAHRGRLITEEEKAKGSIGWKTYMAYVSFCGGTHIAAFVILTFVFTELLNLSTSVWLSFWSVNSFDMEQSTYLALYILLTLLGTGFFPLRLAVSMNAMRRGSVNLHRATLRGLSLGTMEFFDSTPLGRIVNRFSRDVDVTDSALILSVTTSCSTLVSIISSILLTLVAQPIVAIVLVPCGYVYYLIMKFYNATNREIRRTSSIVKSPLFSLLGEVLNGASTISAYGCERAIMKEALRRIDLVYSCSSLENTANRWLGVRIELLSNILVTSITTAGVFMVVSGRMGSKVSVISLALTLALKTTTQLNWLVRCLVATEADMNSVERLVYYATQTPKEDMPELDAEVEALGSREQLNFNKSAQDVIVEQRGSAAVGGNASPSGSMEFRDVCLRYREGLPLVLRGVNFHIKSGEKVGIVGRTGSGKSTLLLTFMRMVEISSGEIIVNGAPIHSFPLRELRRFFSMIPQDPVLFQGTVRQNLDPFLERSDEELWHALSLVGMHTRISSEAEGIDAGVQEGGTNFSVGQRQLLCMARAVLRKNVSFILMDEATANVDRDMDRYIQATVMRTFAGQTVITIAHRLQTVAQYDQIIVMDSGRAVEIGTPYDLVRREGSIFRSMVESMGASAYSLFVETTTACKSR